MRFVLVLLLAIPACDETPQGSARDSARLVASAPRAKPDSAPASDSGLVHIQGPTLVAFYPQVTQAQIDSSEDLATVLDDFSYHLSTAMDSLRLLGITVDDRPTGRLQLLDGGRRRQFLPAKDSADVGYVFLAPGRADRVYYGVMTNADLVAAAHAYLGKRP